MNRDGAIAVCLAAILLFSSLSVAFSLSSFSVGYSDSDSSTEPIEALKRHIDRQPYHPPSVDREVEIVVPLENGTVPRNSNDFTVERVYTEDDQRFARGSIPMSNVRTLLQDSGMNSVRIPNTRSRSNERIARGVKRINADSLQKRGITGENVTVGVIDSDFWISHPSIASRVSAYHQFGNSSNGKHGTTVASVVVDTAPDVNLHLASVGSTTTPEEYASAVEWLERSGADVIVDSGSYYAQPGSGTGDIASIATNVSSDTVFTTSVGNHARRYWTGTHPSGEWVVFHNGTQANPLNSGNPFSGDVRLTLRWDEWSRSNGSTEYDLYLLRVQPGDDAIVARTSGSDDRPIAHLETSVQQGRYYVSIRKTTGPDEGNTSTTTNTNPVPNQSNLELFSNRDLQYRSLGGKAAPANAPGVIAVGTSDAGSIESFSARGADIVAPDSAAVEGVTVEGGTSFSTPYVAGTAALLLSLNPYLTAKEVRTLLVLTADDIGAEGIDPRSGFGLVNATRAIEFMNRTSGDQPTPTALAKHSIDDRKVHANHKHHRLLSCDLTGSRCRKD